MALKRIVIDLAIPEAVYTAIPAAKKLAFRDAVRELKALAVRVNAGSPNEEMSVKATMHTCRHDESPPQPCGAETDI